MDFQSLALTDAEISAVWLSLKVAGVAVLVALPLAIFVGFILARWQFPGRALLNILIVMPLVLPPVVTGYVLLVLFGTQGVIGAFFNDVFGLTFAFRWTGAALAAGVMAFPLLVRPIRQSIEAVDVAYEDTARSLGARAIIVFVTVTLPLAAPGILAGLILGFAKALGEFGATITFVSNIPGETRTLPLSIFTLLQTPNGSDALWRLTGLSVALAVIAVIASEVITRRFASSSSRKAVL